MRRLSLATPALLLALAGCQRLSFEREVTLTDAKKYSFDAPRSDQKVVVKASADQPVSEKCSLQSRSAVAACAVPASASMPPASNAIT